MKAVLRLSFSAWLTNLASGALLKQISIILLGIYLISFTDIGYFNLSFQLADSANVLLVGGFAGVGGSALSAAFVGKNRERLGQTWQTLIKVETVLAAPGLVFCLFNASTITQVLYGSKYAPVGPLLVIFILFNLLVRILGTTVHQASLYVVGNPVIELTHTSDNPFNDLFVRLSDVDAGGRSTNVSEGFVRLTTDAGTTVRLELDAVAHRFTAGSRIRVLVAGGSHPRFARNLGTELIDIPIEPMMEGYQSALGTHLRPGTEDADAGVDPAKPSEPDLAAENIQARIRGNLMMALSNRHGWLVLTTGNKSEMSVGYATLYGDMAGGFAVIKDVPKTLVYQLVERRNERAGTDLVPLAVIERPPSAELRPDQLDSDSLPDYDLLDRILEAYVEEDKGREEMVAAGLPGAVVDEVIRLVDRAEYKRRQAAPGIRITPRAFGRDRRLPITNRFGG